MIAEMAKVWVEEKVSLVTANAYYIDDQSNSLNRTFRDPEAPADESFETLARDGGNACCFGAAMGFEREIYSTFGWPPTRVLGAHDIIIPFYAHLLKGARFIRKPLLKYRVHAENSSLSLRLEAADRVGRLLAEERIFINHLAHAVLFQDELDRLRARIPSRYGEIASRIFPLLTTQTVEMARKLLRTRIELDRIQHGP
jgi:hypothetical protein